MPLIQIPELGQPLWSVLPLVVASIGAKVLNPKVKLTEVSGQQETRKEDRAGTVPQEEIRTRAYQIYEFRNRNGNQADQDWGQAETELMELLHAKER